MFSNIRIGLFTTFAVVVVCLLICEKSLAATVTTPQQYIEYLTEKGETDSEALNAKEQFQKWSKKKQLKFIGYLNDPIVAKAMFADIAPNTKKELYNGDVVIEHTIKEEEIPEPEDKATGIRKILGMATPLFFSKVDAAPQKKQVSHTDSRTLKAYGMNVTKYTVWLKYETTGTEVTKIIAGDGYYHNIYPATTISKQNCDKYIYGKKAHTAIVWSVNIGIPFFNATGTVHHHVLGFANGSKTYRFWKEL